MRAILRSRHPWIALGLLAAFWASTQYVRDGEALIITNCLVLVCAAAVAVRYLPEALRAIRDAEHAHIQHLTIGAVYTWLFAFLWGCWSLMLMLSGQQRTDVESSLSAFLRAGIALGALYVLTSPGAVGMGRMGRAAVVVVVVVLAVALAAVITIVQPDMRPFMASIRPYIPR